MCGISLVFKHDPSLHSIITRMMSSMPHRGPDMQDVYVNQDLNIALGHNRLSIIDLSNHSIQPMHSSNGRYIIVYNGEVYNYKDLKKKLINLGYNFKTNSDTEVLLYGYQEWGKKFFLELNGMWALAILDLVDRKVVISRDRFGMKPVYYYHNNNSFILASEIKAILKAGVKAEVNPHGLNEYFTFQNIISNHTLFKNICMLNPGHNLCLDLVTGKITIEQYWDVEYNNQYEINEPLFCEELYETLRTSVNRVLVSDVPVGAMVSGGMDSSSIVALATSHISGLKTFSGYFDHSGIDSGDRSYNEHEDARLISNYFGTSHYEQIIGADDVVNTLPQIVWHLEDPKVAMCYTFYLISKLVSDHVTVNLSGTGGDEIFGGYPWRYNLIADTTNHADFTKIYYDYWSRLVKDHDKINFFKPAVYNNIDLESSHKAFNEILKNKQDDSSLNKAMYFEIKTFLHGMLIVEDKMGMAHSIETRFPFLENDIVNLACKIPVNYKYKNDESKLLLKKAFAKVLPSRILTKKKQGFTPPDMTWYRKNLSKYVHNLLLGSTSNITEYVSSNYIKNVLHAHNNGQDLRLLIWSLMFFEYWLELFINNSGNLSICSNHSLKQVVTS